MWSEESAGKIRPPLNAWKFGLSHRYCLSSICLSVCLPTCLSISSPTYYLSSIYLHLSIIYLSICLSACLSVCHLSVDHLSTYFLSVNHVYLFINHLPIIYPSLSSSFLSSSSSLFLSHLPVFFSLPLPN